MNICIVGAGTVGLDTYRGFSQLGHQMTLYDIDKEVLNKLAKDDYGTVQHRLSDALALASIVFICVPAPTHERGMNLRCVVDAAMAAAKQFRRRKDYCAIVVRSTVLPYAMDEVVSPLVDAQLGLCHNPSFITEGKRPVQVGFDSEPRIVIGERDSKAGDIVEEAYKPLGKPIIRTDFNTSAMIKYAANCALATRLSYWSEIHLICKELGIDSQLVADAVTMDARIGKYGSLTGLAFGGKCLDKDLAAFVRFAEKYHVPKLLNAVWAVNDKMAREYGVWE